MKQMFLFKNTSFTKKFIKYNGPIFLSQIFFVIISSINGIVIGQLGEVNQVAVSIGDKINGIYWPIIGSIATYVGIKYVKNDKNDPTKKLEIFWLSNILMLTLSLLTFIFIQIGGKFIISQYTKEDVLIAEALRYLTSLSISNIFASCTFSLLTYLNCSKKVKETSIIASIQIFINFLFNYIFIIKLRNIINSQVDAVSISIIITKIVEFLMYLYVYLFKSERIKGILKISIIELIKIIKRIIPLSINNLIITISYNVIFIGFSRFSIKSGLAFSIADNLVNNIILILSGITVTSKFLIGNLIQKKKLKSAKIYSKKIMLFSLYIGLILVIIVNILGRYIIEKYNIDKTTYEMAYRYLNIISLFSIFKVLNGLLVEGILRIGGDIKGTIRNEVFGILFFGVGSSVVFSKVFPVSQNNLLTIISLNELIRFLLNLYRYKKLKWLRKEE